MTSALACKSIEESEEESKNHNEVLERCVKTINQAIETGKVRDLFSLDEKKRQTKGKADILIMLSLMLYP